MIHKEIRRNQTDFKVVRSHLDLDEGVQLQRGCEGTESDSGDTEFIKRKMVTEKDQ